MKDININNVRSKVLSATLSFQPPHCYQYGHVFDSDIIKYGFKISRIKMMKLSIFDTDLDLKKQRYKYRHCNRTFTFETSLVESNYCLSNSLKQAIFLEASHKKSESNIPHELNVSHSIVNRIIHTSYEEHPFHLIPFQRYKNGVLEGMNNQLKVIKRIARGYRSFYHFKARILIIHKYIFEQQNKRNQTTQRAA